MTQGVKIDFKVNPEHDDVVDAYEKEIAMQKCKKAFMSCGIGSQYFGARLKDYCIKYGKQADIIKSTRKFFDEVLSGHQVNMIIVGDAGEGKTELAAGLLKQFAFTKKTVRVNGHELEAYYSVKYITSFELCCFFRKASRYATKDYSEFSFFRDFAKTYDILVIDEVGKSGEKNEWDILFSVLDKRMQESKWTVLISNLSYKDLSSNLSEYSISRLNAGGKLIVIDTTGLPDFRQNPLLLDT